MFTKHDRSAARHRRHARVRRRVRGTSTRPRLSVHRSLRHMIAQVIDDTTGRTLAAASTLEADVRTKSASGAAAAAVGQRVAERAQAAGVTDVVFDRGGYLYHGRVKQLAEAARLAGMRF